MIDFMRKIFSVTNEHKLKVVILFGKRFEFENKKWYKKRCNNDIDGIERSKFIDSFQDKIIAKYIDKEFLPEEYIKNIINPDYLEVDRGHNYLNILLNNAEWEGDIKNLDKHLPDEYLISWEIRPNDANYKTMKFADKNDKKVIFIGDSFLSSINTRADKNALLKYKKSIAFTIDDLTSYFDATRPSRIEQMLNNKDLIITEEQKTRARKCINKIVENHLTKYNHQPIYKPQIGREGVKKILVVDQSYGDMSILKGLGSEKVFKNMLEAAIKENPQADIIVKTHPDTIVGMGGYYTKLKAKNNIYLQTTPINPISLIQYCDKVYVCTTQFGFEALMCDKEVHVFGMPFYAGWGATIDAQKCERRTNKRSLEEIFYIAYILYSYYVNPDKNCRCEIEEAMDYLLRLRKEYDAAQLREEYFNKVARNKW